MLSDCDLYYPKRATKLTFIRQGISACATSCHWQSILSRRLTIHNRHLIDTLIRHHTIIENSCNEEIDSSILSYIRIFAPKYEL